MSKTNTPDTETDAQPEKEAAKEAFLAAWNQKGSLPHLTDLERRTAINHFETWWSGRE